MGSSTQPDPRINGERIVSPGARPSLTPIEIRLREPFVQPGGFEDLPGLPDAQVRFFEGERNFRTAVRAQKQSVWPIGRFSSRARPANEQEFKEQLRAHAARIGADYVVVLTDAAEISRLFPLGLNLATAYGALAYKRAPARLGLDFEPAAAARRVLKVTAFLPGSRAEEAGVRVGDVVKTIAGKDPLQEEDAYWRQALHWQPGDTVRLKVDRDGVEREFDIVLGTAP